MRLDWRVTLMCITLVGAGCYDSMVFSNPLQVDFGSRMEWRTVDPEQFKVNPENYPRFKVQRTIQPPKTVLSIPIVEINEGDIWEVAYKFGDFYLIHSQSYDDRQCLMLSMSGVSGSRIAHVSPFTGKCRSQYRYCIFVDLTGAVTAGWGLIFNPEVAVSKSTRAQSIKPVLGHGDAWGAQPTFVRL